jgi:hypothetical protein
MQFSMILKQRAFGVTKKMAARIISGSLFLMRGGKGTQQCL